MLMPRVIPVLLLRGEGLVKTHKFKEPRYVGDPINAVRIFNEKEVDELIFLDITASREGRPPNFEMVRQIASECFMPLGYGGGVRTVDDAGRLFSIGVEKVVINNAALADTRLIASLATRFGSQAIVGAIDFKRRTFGGIRVFDHRVNTVTDIDPIAHARRLVDAGVGEILINSVDRDGTKKGYIVDAVRSISDAVSVPVIASGGAGSLADIRQAIREGHASAAAAGAMFVFHGRHDAVLITYPPRADLVTALSS